MVKPLAVVAVGGNALIQDEQRNSIPDQYVAVMESVQHIVASSPYRPASRPHR